jgi:hypothetical protein
MNKKEKSMLSRLKKAHAEVQQAKKKFDEKLSKPTAKKPTPEVGSPKPVFGVIENKATRAMRERRNRSLIG